MGELIDIKAPRLEPPRGLVLSDGHVLDLRDEREVWTTKIHGLDAMGPDDVFGIREGGDELVLGVVDVVQTTGGRRLMCLRLLAVRPYAEGGAS